jgi:hypothetical protein
MNSSKGRKIFIMPPKVPDHAQMVIIEMIMMDLLVYDL